MALSVEGRRHEPDTCPDEIGPDAAFPEFSGRSLLVGDSGSKAVTQLTELSGSRTSCVDTSQGANVQRHSRAVVRGPLRLALPCR
jgi:hypothetical protein